MQKRLICEICGKEIINGRHCYDKHKIHSKEYYDLYLKQENEDRCPVCGEKTTFQGLFIGYSKHCSTKCSTLDPLVQQKVKQTCLTIYGTEHHLQNEDIKNKSRKTKKEKYGDEHYTNREKAKQTYKEHYGTDHNMKSEKGLAEYNESMQKNYGVNWTWEIPDVQEKSKQTLLENLGVDNSFKSINIKKKVFETIKEKGNRSRIETYFENLLIKKQIKFESNYSNEAEYPYLCDFYLPEYKLYVEINNFWCHNNHFFDENNEEDLSILEKWLSKNTSTYNRAIDIWTKSDIEKRNCAIKNHLNYVVLWNIQQIDQFFNNFLNTSYTGFIDFNVFQE